MTTQEKIEAINTLCFSSEFSALNRLLGDAPGAFAILISDQTAEQKRQALLELLQAMEERE